MKIKLFSIILAINLIITSAFSIEPDIFVQSTVNRASKLLGENITKEEKIEKLKSIAKETVDIRGIGFYTLGAIRKTLNDEQKKKCATYFAEHLTTDYCSCIDYAGNCPDKEVTHLYC